MKVVECFCFFLFVFVQKFIVFFFFWGGGYGFMGELICFVKIL